MTMENIQGKPCNGERVILPSGAHATITDVIRYKGDGKFDCVISYLNEGRNGVVYKKNGEWYAITHHKSIYK